MRTRSLVLRCRYSLRSSRMLQIGLIFGFWLLGQAIAHFAGIPVPGGIIGMVIVLALLLRGHIRLSSMRHGAQWYLAEMLLFFVPAVLAVLNHHELFGMLGLKVLIVILGSTLAVLGVTAMVIELCLRFGGQHHAV